MTSGAPAVSIVIATYNRARLLPESMDTVLGQDYPDLELLVVDDGSTDRTRRVLKRYARRNPPRRFRYVSQANGGQARALNHGYGLARGELIGYLPDDDLLESGAVAKQAEALVADPDAAVAYSGYRVINAEGVVEDVVRPIQHTPTEAVRLHDTVIGPGGLVRRAALEASSGWPESMRMMADLVLWVEIGLRGHAVRLAEPLVSWRRHAGSVTLNLGAEHSREHLIAYRRALALDGFPELTEAERAEGLRNACVWGAIMGGAATSWPGDRYFVCDLHRKLISAAAAGWDLTAAPDWSIVERAAQLYSELVATMIELAHERHTPPPPAVEAVGVEAAEEMLRAVGVAADEHGAFREVEEAEMRLGLIEAAVAAGAITKPEQNRFRIIDLRRTRLREEERAALERLGFVGTADETAAELERCRHELSRLRGGLEPTPAPR